MSLRSWQVVTLLLATVTMGLTAGVFGDWAHTIMWGLGTTDDRTFVGAFQALDRAILNPLSMLTFTGALALSGVAAVLYLRDDDHTVLPWVAVAFGLYLASFVKSSPWRPTSRSTTSSGLPGTRGLIHKD